MIGIVRGLVKGGLAAGKGRAAFMNTSSIYRVARHFSSDKNLVEFAFQNKDGSLTVVNGKIGESVLDVAHKFGVDLEGACESSLACR
jgi:hypothetical protein